MFPNEDELPRERKAIKELLDAAREAKLSFRYVNVIRHRLMDAVVRDLVAEGRVHERDLNF